MITIDDLKKVTVLQGFSEAIIARIQELATEQPISEGDIVYTADDPADNVYIVKSGKVVMEADVAPGMTVALASIKPGYIFGWYGMVPSTSHTMHARVVADGTLIVLPGDAMRMLMDENHDFGYQLMNKMYMLLKNRLDHRTQQLLKVLGKHPDLRHAGE